MNIHKTVNIGLIAIVLLILLLPFLGTFADIEPEDRLLENRALSNLPAFEFSSESLKSFPDAFKAYFSDHYGYRKFMTYLNILIHFKYLDAKVMKEIIPGKEGWLFWGGDKVIDHMKASRPLSETMHSDRSSRTNSPVRLTGKLPS